MDGWTDGWTDGRMDGWMDIYILCMYVWHVRMYLCVCVSERVCADAVHVYIYTHKHTAILRPDITS